MAPDSDRPLLDYQNADAEAVNRSVGAAWRRRIIFLIIAVPLAIIIGTVVRVAWWYAGFKQRLRLADQHAPIVRKALEADGRFLEIEAGSFTGADGCLLVQALVPKGASPQLKAIVAATSPPVRVEYYLIEKGPATRPAQ